MIVLKLGGSVVTEKGSRETLDGDSLARAADAIATVADRMVLVHGGGSFGHHHADRHGVSSDDGTDDHRAVMDVHGAMVTLNRFVLDRLHDREVPALPVHPLSTGSRGRNGELDLPLGQVETMVGEGFLPVLHGDGIAHAGEGVTVLSGDEIVVEVAGAFEADRVGLCTTVPGVLDGGGDVIDRIEDYEQVADTLGESDETDVTGGMAAKVRALLDLDSPAWVFDLDGLGDFLDGGSPGTEIR